MQSTLLRMCNAIIRTRLRLQNPRFSASDDRNRLRDTLRSPTKLRVRKSQEIKRGDRNGAAGMGQNVRGNSEDSENLRG